MRYLTDKICEAFPDIELTSCEMVQLRKSQDDENDMFPDAPGEEEAPELVKKVRKLVRDVEQHEDTMRVWTTLDLD